MKENEPLINKSEEYDPSNNDEEIHINPCYIIYLLLVTITLQMFFIIPFGHVSRLVVSEPLYAFQDNILDKVPNITSTGITVYRNNAEIFNYDCIYHFYDQVEKPIVEEPFLDGFAMNVYPPSVYAPIAVRYCEKLNIYHLKNAYVKHVFVIILSNGDSLTIITRKRNWKPPYIINGTTIEPRYGFKNLFFVPMQFPQFFSHWLTDVLPAIVLMPSWFWDLNPTIVTVFNRDYVNYSLNHVGLGHVDFIQTTNYVYGENVFVAHGNELWNAMGLYAAKVIKQKYRAYHGLDKIEPVNYRFINKNNNNRRFTNLNEIIELANAITGKNWSLITTQYTERDAYAREFASCLVLVVPCGSLAFNSIYMRDGTGIVSLCAKRIDNPQNQFCYYINIWNIGIMHPYMKFKGQAAPANVFLTLQVIDIMMYTVEHQHFPPDMDMFQAMYIDDAKKYYYEYGDHKFIHADHITKQRLKDYFQRKNQTLSL